MYIDETQAGPLKGLALEEVVKFVFADRRNLGQPAQSPHRPGAVGQIAHGNLAGNERVMQHFAAEH